MEPQSKIKETVSRRGKYMIIINDVFLFNIKPKTQDNTKLFKCMQYKTTYKCKFFF